MAISASQVKELREATGVGMMDCKRALEEAGGDLEKAKDLLRQQGKAKGAKREGRATGEGTLAVSQSDDLTRLVVLELNCETDFVGRSDDFRALASSLADKALAENVDDGDALDAQEQIDEATGRIGEKIRVGRIINWTAADNGAVVPYLHTATHRAAAVVELGYEGERPSSEALTSLGRDLAMQITAMRPMCVSRQDVPAAEVDREREVLRKAQDMANKPPQIQDKIIEGRLGKFYGEVCLLEQPFTREPDKSVQQYVDEASKKAGSKLTVRRFERLEVGQGGEAAADDES